MGKMAFVFVGIALLVSSLRLMGGTYAFVESGELPESDHPIDLLVKGKIETLSTDTMICEMSRLVGYYGGSLLTPHYVSAYSTAKRIDVTEVERDFFDLFSKALFLYNDIPEIRPYLAMYPVTAAEDFLVSIRYGSRPRTFYALPYYCLAMNMSKELELLKMERPGRGPGEQPRSYRPISHLPEFIELSTLGIPRKRERVPVPIIVDKTVRCFLRNLEALKPVLQKMCALHDVHISALQCCTIGNSDTREIGAGFWTQRVKMPLDQARAFVEQFIDDYLSLIRQKRVVEQSNKRNAKVLQDIRENLNWFCFRITFWDEYLNRVEEPYIAQVQCQDGMLYYCTADEGQRLQQVFEEPVPERLFPR